MPGEIAEPSTPVAIDSAAQTNVGATIHGTMPPGMQPCELRWERTAADAGAGRREIVCMAAAGKRLALVGGDEREMHAIRGSCTAPTETARRPCLFVIPIKTERGARVQDYFTCWWFYRMRPERPATETEAMCSGCIYWFPRPPTRLFPDLHGVTRRMIRYHQDAWAGCLPPSPFAAWNLSPSVPVSRWRRLVRRITGWFL
jgi:hypothetical protein